MEDLDQEPEEIPMEEVLAEIRRMLSAKVEEKPTEQSASVQGSLSSTDEVVYNPPVKQAEVVSKKPTPTSELEDYFLLTPAMRCDDLFNSGSPEQVKLQTQKVLQKLGQETVKVQLSPEVEAWLNQNLPAIVERVVAKQLSGKAV